MAKVGNVHLVILCLLGLLTLAASGCSPQFNVTVETKNTEATSTASPAVSTPAKRVVPGFSATEGGGILGTAPGYRLSGVSISAPLGDVGTSQDYRLKGGLGSQLSQ